MRLLSSIDQHVKTNVSRSMDPYPPGILTNASIGVRRNDCLEAKKEANTPAFNKKSIATAVIQDRIRALTKLGGNLGFSFQAPVRVCAR